MGHGKNVEKKRKKHRSSDQVPDGSGWGDHIQLLQIYEQWHENDYNVNWCIDKNLQVRGMMFVKDVRKQLSQIMEKHAKDVDSLHVRISRRRRKESKQEYYKSLRKALCVGYANQVAERKLLHNGYHTLLGFKSQLVQVHPSSALMTRVEEEEEEAAVLPSSVLMRRHDENRLLPDYVVYHELISTTTRSPYLRNVCAVEMSWVLPILSKLENLNVNKLRGGTERVALEEEDSNASMVAKVPEDNKSKIEAARARFLARKAGLIALG